MSKLTRRQTVGALTGAVAGIAVAGVATASASTTSERKTAGPARPGGSDGPAPFDEVFEGRRIQGLRATGAHAAHAHHGSGYRVLIDGRELHLMLRADNTWTSAINHYQTFRTPLEAARTAVTTLQGAHLVPLPTA
ncbi:tyrosinase cofactor [Streptomyces sp. CAU 1734]|uniref:apotyrosinase chaperone MelC1 n=1 Tax=Streptomyces sp. CAU 1734 TaxID=3140360 RepID=UPI00326126F2